MRGIETNDANVLALWCRDYNQFGPHQVGFKDRFSIGIYQIYQGIEWNDKASEYESFAAAAIHMICAAESLNLELDLPRLIDDNFHRSKNYIDWMEFTKHLSRAQQHIFYRQVSAKNGYHRKSRYNPVLLTSDLSYLVNKLFGMIPRGQRMIAAYYATEIMSGRL